MKTLRIFFAVFLSLMVSRLKGAGLWLSWSLMVTWSLDAVLLWRLTAPLPAEGLAGSVAGGGRGGVGSLAGGGGVGAGGIGEAAALPGIRSVLVVCF